MGPTLSLVALPPTAPQPRVRAGWRPVMAPTPPRAAEVFTSRRLTGFLRANSRITALSWLWRLMVWPAPSIWRIWRHRSQADCHPSSTKKARMGHSFSRMKGSPFFTSVRGTTSTLVPWGMGKPARSAMTAALLPTMAGFMVPLGRRMKRLSLSASSGERK